MSKRNTQPANGSDLRGPQLVVAEPLVPSSPDATVCAVGESLSPPEATVTQLRALESIVAQMKIAIADATLQIAAIHEQREQLMVQVRGSTERYIQAARAAATGLGIDLTQAWSFDSRSGSFTRTR